MSLLSALHRWCGGFIGLLLAVLGLSGAILVWEGDWISLPGAGDLVVQDVRAMGAIAEVAAAGGELSRITFASDEIGLHQLVYADGGGAYVRQDGTVVDRWASSWERPELWLFDLHHHLFAGDTGATVTGTAGIAGLVFVVTGVILWWRSRRNFSPRLWPKRFAPGPIVSHHRDIGLLAAPLLILSMATGVLIIFAPLRAALLGPEQRPRVTIQGSASQDIAGAIALANSLFPDAMIRRVTLREKASDQISIRMRRPFEWTPNGRTLVAIAGGGTATIENAATANRGAGLSEKLYPLHSAKVGGFAWKLSMTASGVALAVLGSFTTWSFWARRRRK